MSKLVTPKTAERERRNARICKAYIKMRRAGGQKMSIYKHLGAIYHLAPFWVSRIVKKGVQDE